MARPLENLMNAIIETIIEGIEREPWHAFINNGVAFTGVAMKNKQLIEEIKEVQLNPDLLVGMEERSVKKFGKKRSTAVASIVFKHVWGMIVYNTSSIIAIDMELREHYAEVKK